LIKRRAGVVQVFPDPAAAVSAELHDEWRVPRQTPHEAKSSSGGGELGGEGSVFVEACSVAQTEVELAEQPVEKVAEGGSVPVTALAASTVVGVSAG
jgi:hypothetical protein